VHNRSPDSTLPPSSVLAVWSQIAVQIGTLTGKTFEIAENMAGLIREAGFMDVVEKRFRWPIGPWSSDARLKELGRWNLLNWEEGMEGWILANYTRVLGVGFPPFFGTILFSISSFSSSLRLLIFDFVGLLLLKKKF